jgi:hypothetical protein
MKITDILLTILICLIAWQKIPAKEQKTVSSQKESQGIVFGQTVKETKDIQAVSLDKNKDEVKHSSTARNYVDSDGRINTSLNHNIRIGKDYFVSGGVYSRQSDYQQNYGTEISITKMW